MGGPPPGASIALFAQGGRGGAARDLTALHHGGFACSGLRLLRAVASLLWKTLYAVSALREELACVSFSIHPPLLERWFVPLEARWEQQGPLVSLSARVVAVDVWGGTRSR